MATADKKVGRKAAGSWGRPGSKQAKRTASKAGRRSGKRAAQNY